MIQSRLVFDGLRCNDTLTNGDMWRSAVMCHYWWSLDQYKESHHSPGWVGMIKWEKDTGRWSPGIRPDYNTGDKSNTGHYNGIRLRRTLLSQCQLFPSQQSNIHFWIPSNDQNWNWCSVSVTPLLLSSIKQCVSCMN